MRHFILIILIIPFFIKMAFALPVNENKAKQIAESFIQHKAELKGYGLKGDMLTVRTGMESTWFLFSHDNAWVMMSGDTDMYPVLAYSLESGIKKDQIAPAMQSYIDAREKQAVSLRDKQIKAENNRLAWKALAKQKFTKSNRRSVDPLLETRWGQNWPYNAECPAHPDGSGGHVPVGCVATAMGQIMNYHEYPETGRFSNSTYWGTEIEVDFSEAEYDWEAMGETINSQSQDEIATLLYHCGVAVDMNYDPTGSGSNISNAEYALKYHFKYKPGSDFVEKTNYSDPDWKFLLKEDLDKAHPILYRGVNDLGAGHAFVCDGYQDTSYFHFDWGWSGSGNGYFHIEGIDFHWNQGAAINIMPYWDEYCNSMVYTQESWTFDDGSGPNYAWKDTDCQWLIQPESGEEIALRFKHFETRENDVLKVYDGSTTDATLIGSYSGTSLPPEILSSGNSLLLHFITDNGEQSFGWTAEYETVSASGKTEVAAEAFSLYPNPANDKLFMYVPGKSQVDVTVFTPDGSVVTKQTMDPGKNHLDVKQFSRGLYIMNITGDAESMKRKFVVE